MSSEGYSILIFGDAEHPEVKGVQSYGEDQDDVHIILEPSDLEKVIFKNNKIATVAQTTKKKEKYLEIVNALIFMLDFDIKLLLMSIFYILTQVRNRKYFI